MLIINEIDSLDKQKAAKPEPQKSIKKASMLNGIVNGIENGVDDGAKKLPIKIYAVKGGCPIHTITAGRLAHP